MAATHSDEFKRDAVRIALTSGLPRCQVASDLGVGLSTLGKWVRSIPDEAKAPERDADLLSENERLRKENSFSGTCKDQETVRGTASPQQEGSAKKGSSILRDPKAVKFEFIASYRGSLSRRHLGVVAEVPIDQDSLCGSM